MPIMSKNDDFEITPPREPVQSIQYDLFRQFITNDESSVSNTIEFWECIPKYFLTPKQIEKHLPEHGQPDPFRWKYVHDGQEYTVVIQPALLEEEDGSYKAYFPGATEELVEEALKKILSDQNFGIHDPAKHETWVRFSLSMIHKELQSKNRTRNRVQIKQAIQVLSRSVLTLYRGKKEIWSGNILQDLVTVDREKYLADSKQYHVGRLPLFISRAIDRLESRQFNYERLMSCSEQLSRWIYRRLIHRYVQADHCNRYHFMYSDILHSGLLQQSDDGSNRKKVISALKELITKEVINSYDVDAKKAKNGVIVDAKYTVTPSAKFIGEQKAANKRNKDNLTKAVAHGYSLPPVDMS